MQPAASCVSPLTGRPIRVRQADWRSEAAAIAAVRRAVFIDEQGVPEALEWEALDARCTWFVAQTEAAAEELIGVVRLTPEGRVGRMAVRAAWRRRGVGRALMLAVLEYARVIGLTELSLAAQTHALGFYQRFGFVAEGELFEDAGIPHRRMRLNMRP